ncbi:cilia- and flagella-associated protein 77 [Brachionichthys hirsutus]|uniref:cilia- and flagella-associated protein 77 n=1 Tax=Brachionichthys hirsutus TaxID=412623 RepID=UPI00360510EB
MSSPRLGLVRDSMLSNPLLVKAPLGKSRARGLSGPGPDFTFGTSSGSRDGGVAEVLSSWRVQSKRDASAGRVPPDFVSLNRDAVRSGLVTSKDMSQYRAQRGGAGTLQNTPNPRRTRAPPVPDVTFGLPTRPPSPLADLIAHRYGQRWLDEQRRRSQTINRRQQQKVKTGSSADTRTSLLRRSKALPVTKTPFKMRWFSQVPSALDTFRDEEARRRAFKIPRSDSVREESSGSGNPRSGPEEETP